MAGLLGYLVLNFTVFQFCFLVGKMSTTSQKFRNFQSEPIGEKEVTCVAGIGDVLGGRLVEKGYDKVCGLFFGVNFLRLL